jgi:hypothetical protein
MEEVIAKTEPLGSRIMPAHKIGRRWMFKQDKVDERHLRRCPEEFITIDQAIANIKESLQAAYAAEDRLKGLLKHEGLLP